MAQAGVVFEREDWVSAANRAFEYVFMTMSVRGRLMHSSRRSTKRGAGVVEELRANGVADELLDRIDVPAGIPIGSHSGAEIALSVLAKVVEVRRNGGASMPAPAEAPAPAAAVDSPKLAVDPICGMTVAAVPSSPHVERDGETTYFCSEGCKAKFEAGEHASVAG
jgi:xanthine dehydrogenase accessory factor